MSLGPKSAARAEPAAATKAAATATSFFIIGLSFMGSSVRPVRTERGLNRSFTTYVGLPSGLGLSFFAKDLFIAAKDGKSGEVTERGTRVRSNGDKLRRSTIAINKKNANLICAKASYPFTPKICSLKPKASPDANHCAPHGYHSYHGYQRYSGYKGYMPYGNYSYQLPQLGRNCLGD